MKPTLLFFFLTSIFEVIDFIMLHMFKVYSLMFWYICIVKSPPASYYIHHLHIHIITIFLLSFLFLWQEDLIKICPLSIFQIYGMVLLTIVSMLYIRSLELTHLAWLTFRALLTNIVSFSSPAHLPWPPASFSLLL